MRRAILTGVSAALLSSCGSNGTTIAHDGNGGSTVTMGDTGHGPAMVAKVAAPDQTVAPSDLPAWAPVYPGATVSQVVDVAFNGAAGMPGGPRKQVVLMTADPIPKVMAFYDQRLAAAGVKPMMSSNTADGAMRAINTPSGQPDAITVGKADTETAVAISYAVKR